LGVDLTPVQDLQYDCIYCQLGRTDVQDDSSARSGYLWIASLPNCRTADQSADYIKLSGSGEPTLYSRVGELIAQIKT